MSTCVPVLLQSLSAPVAFSIGSSYMMQLEIMETGLQWSNLNIQPVSPSLLSEGLEEEVLTMALSLS